MDKLANTIIVGGPIAVGKSTLSGSLNYPCIYELDSNDELQNILIKKMYKGDVIAKQIFQLDLMVTRHQKYCKIAKSKKMYVFDRSILEDRLFAEFHLKDDPLVLQYYINNWNDAVDEMIHKYGKPRLYILLTCNWEVFKERIFKRNRDVEIKNWDLNENYFRKILNSYEKYMVDIFKKYQIDYFKIKTDNLNAYQVREIALKALKEHDL